jgi:hypothetical protein
MPEEQIDIVSWTNGYEIGIIAERARILDLLREKAESRDIMQSLSYPFLFDELALAIIPTDD